MKFAQMIFTAAIAFVSAGGIGCTRQVTEPPPPAYVEPAKEEPAKEEPSANADISDMKADNSLAYDLNEYMPKDQNYMFSPLSIKMALALAANGAEGETQAEILKAAGIDDIDKFNAYSKKLIGDYAEEDVKDKKDKNKDDDIFYYDEDHEKTQLSIANSVWLNTDKAGNITFKDDYLKTVKAFFDADVENVTMQDAVARVNGWCSDKTNGKIPSIISKPDFLAALVNAVYFKGEWSSQFEEYMTKDGTFTDRNGSKQTVKFMEQTDDFAYYEDNDVQIVKMPYYGGKAAMYVVLSNDKRIDITAYTDKTTYQKVHIKLPKFKTEYSETINEMLNKIGINKAFAAYDAEFGKMLQGGTNQFYIDKVLHKTYIDVDENGTEAAAVTAVMMEGTSIAEPQKPVIKDFIADKPFGYFIIDSETNEILFMGEYAFAN